MALYRRQELWQLCHPRYGQKFAFIENIATDSQAETKHFIYFYLGHCAILLFKTQ